MQETYSPESVLDLWFPEDGHWTSPKRHAAFWDQRMQGGMDVVICRDFAALTRAAARGELDLWAETPRGRLALLIALDQFPRSLWRGTPGAFAQDIKAARLALDGISNGHFAQLRPWEQSFYAIALSHCEGPDHLARFDVIDAITEEIIAGMPPEISPMGEIFRTQNARVRSVIERFGRHPHRNPIYGRISSLEEEAYIATGDFPHVQKVADKGT
jgi:uncharacterized protein (DUF924 family)